MSYRSKRIMKMALKIPHLEHSISSECESSIGEISINSGRESSSFNSLNGVPEEFRDIVRNINVDSPEAIIDESCQHLHYNPLLPSGALEEHLEKESTKNMVIRQDISVRYSDKALDIKNEGFIPTGDIADTVYINNLQEYSYENLGANQNVVSRNSNKLLDIENDSDAIDHSNSDDDPTYHLSDSDCENEIFTTETSQPEEITKSVLEELSNAKQNTELLNKEKVSIKVSRVPDFCFYCENEVQNYARHIQRNHSYEIEVQRILSMTPKSVERKRSIASLRKRGNYLKNINSVFKPVHKSYVDQAEVNYVPCMFCLGFYSRKLLWKHVKNCPENKQNIRTNLSDAQNLLLPKLEADCDLLMKVFPRMRADKVSLFAKKDPLICAYGARYLNTHREQHHINVCSRKMRELSKVLIETQKLSPSIKNLYDLLSPKHFDVIVRGVKTIAKYDAKNDVYLSPSFGMNISRTLKDCCDITILHLVKRKYNYHNVTAAEAEANISTFKSLLESTWKHEISSQAAKDLNTKTWNKTTIIPLAADLNLFRTYLIKKATATEVKLRQNPTDTKSYILLLETVFCRLLLLNRKRVGELQRMKLVTYTSVENNSLKSYDEFTDTLTFSEKILCKSFKRVVTRGKRGRGVPVLFSKDIQDHLNILLQTRPQNIPQSNLYLFASNKSDQPIVGYKVVQKHADLCGARNPAALTSTRLRKHLATLMQVFNMTGSDIEQLATFMGHTADVHKTSYRLPDDIFQTAKVAKLLMLMERGEAGKYKGKALEDIDLNLEEYLDIGDSPLEEDVRVKNVIEDIVWSQHEPTEKNKDMDVINVQSTNSETGIKNNLAKKRILVPWTTPQKAVVLDFFKDHILNKKPPKRGECDSLLDQFPDLFKNKHWTKIKVFVQNIYTKKK